MTTTPTQPNSVHIITARNGSGVLKECVAVTSLPLSLTIADALRGIWGNANVSICSRVIDEVPSNILAEIDAMENPNQPTGLIGGGRHG